MKRRNLILSIVLMIVVVIVIIVIAVVATILNEPKVEISFENFNNIPSAELRKARTKMVGVIADNTVDFDSGKVYKGLATDYNENSFGDTTTASFIVNFDEIQESYKVEVSWPDPDDGSPNVTISCALLDGKYPETPCKTEVNSSDNIASYLPYAGNLNSGEKYEIVGRYDGGDLYLEIQVNSCGNVNVLEQTLAAAREWLLSINFGPEEFLLYVPGDICETEAILDYYPYIQANHAKTLDANVNANLPYYIPEAYNVYPVVDADGNVQSISAKVPGCLEYQREPGIMQVQEYLSEHSINYPVVFEECEE